MRDHGQGRWVPALLGGGSLGTVIALVLTIGVSWLVRGSGPAVSIVTAIGLVWLFFVTGIISESLLLLKTDLSGLTLTLIGYLIRLFGVFSVLWLLSKSGFVTSLSREWIAVGTVTGILGWLIGVLVSHSRLRIPVYDSQRAIESTSTEISTSSKAAGECRVSESEAG